MTPSNHEQNKRHAFDSFCKKILKHEARDYYDEINRRRGYEVSLGELSEQELAQLSVLDEYFKDNICFRVLGHDVVVSDKLIAEALHTLPADRRDIILLAYFLEMTDREIGEKLNLVRRTVAYRRTSSLRQLRDFLEQEDKANEKTGGK